MEITENSTNKEIIEFIVGDRMTRITSLQTTIEQLYPIIEMLEIRKGNTGIHTNETFFHILDNEEKTTKIKLSYNYKCEFELELISDIEEKARLKANKIEELKKQLINYINSEDFYIYETHEEFQLESIYLLSEEDNILKQLYELLD